MRRPNERKPLVRHIFTADPSAHVFNGKIYIYLGVATEATKIELVPHHSVYHYYNGALRLWTGPV